MRQAYRTCYAIIKAMSLLRIFTPPERDVFESPPLFTSIDRKKYFSFPVGIMNVADGLRTQANKLYFLVMFGYFKATQKFYRHPPHQRDIDFVCQKLNIVLPEDKDHYKKRTSRRHVEQVLTYCGFKKFDRVAATLLETQMEPLMQSQTQPKIIFQECCDLLRKHKIEIPAYNALATLITRSLQRHQKAIIKNLNANLTANSKKMLDLLLTKKDGSDSPSGWYRLTLLKKFSQSAKPVKVKANITDLLILQELFQTISSVLSALDLTSEAIKYYAHCVIKFKMLQVLRRSDEERYLYLISFITHQYYSLQDVLLDILIASIQATLNRVSLAQKEYIFEMRKEKAVAIDQMIELTKHQQELLDKVQTVLSDILRANEDKIKAITSLLMEHNQDHNAQKGITAFLQKETSRLLKNSDYYDILETQSLKLQNRVSEIVKHIAFDEEASNKNIIAALVYYKQTDGNITQSAATDFLDEVEQEIVFDQNNKLRVSLYKVLLFIHVATLIRSGGLNIKHSYKYRAFDAYLLPKEVWKTQTETLLAKADLMEFSDKTILLEELKTKLAAQYEKTNSRINAKQNQYIHVKEHEHFSLITPRKDEEEQEGVWDLFPKARVIPLLEVLSTINAVTRFTDSFAHFQTKHVGKKPKEKIFFAGIMGLGCNIGTIQLAQISRNINENELDNTVNWYFSIENLLAANDVIIRFIDRLSVPKLFKKDQTKTHTSSDGQKFAIGVDSLNANYSYKYFGKGKGVSVYSFIDDTHSLFYSTVISSSEREAAYVIDGLLHNDVVKSDIHSTDTHGYSEIIFALTYLLGFSFAPRIRNFQEQHLYSFEKRKNYEEKAYLILPAGAVQIELIKEYWDEILRLIATIKLKETTASQLLKRLSSYSRQHPLYRALKAFGQIIKSMYLLQYIDDVTLRQAIEKQLNKLESANRFAKAVFYGNNQEFQQETKGEQLIAEGCKRLIENAILCWNYLYISQKIADTMSEEERSMLLKRIKQSSIIAWGHINLHGEYDFSEEKLKPTIPFSLPKIYELQVG